MAEKTYRIGHERAKQILADIRQIDAQDGDWRATLNELEETFEHIAEATQEPERVIFRKFPWDSKAMALFPDQYNEATGNIGCYTFDGGKEETSPDFGDTVAAEPHEYNDLLNELRRQDYHNLRIVKRFGKLGK